MAVVSGTVAAIAAVVTAVVGAYSAKEQRVASNKANDVSRALAREQNDIARRQENLAAARNRVQARRQMQIAQANAAVAGIGAGIVNPFGQSATSFVGATASYQTQFAINEGYTNQGNASNLQMIELNQRAAENESTFRKTVSRLQSISATTKALSSMVSSGYDMYRG